MFDLIRRVVRTTTWADLVEGVIFAALLLALALMPEHLSDTGRAVTHFVNAVRL